MFGQIFIGAIMIGSVYGLLALGYSLIYSASGLMTFVQGDLLMIGAFLGLTFYKYLSMPFFIAFIITIIIMFGIGLLVERFIIRKLVGAGANIIFIVLATIALSIILQNLAMIMWGSSVYQFPPIFNKSLLTIGTIQIAPESIMAIIISLLVMVLLHFFMNKTRFGTAMRAAAQNPLAARTLAINVSLTTGVTWGISSVLAGIAGMVIGPVYGVHMTMGSMIGLKGFAGAVIGGYGNMYGAIVGSLFLGIVETFTAGYISSIYKDVISFLLLIVFLALKPRGIFNAEVLQE